MSEERRIPTEAVIRLLQAGEQHGAHRAMDWAVDLWSVTNTALAMLIADLHLAGVVDAESLAERLSRQADSPEASPAARGATEILVTQMLGFAAQGGLPTST